ncbi:NADH:ubiquinone reductase (H(+)-translocating) [Bertholletia excelsa]
MLAQITESKKIILLLSSFGKDFIALVSLFTTIKALFESRFRESEFAVVGVEKVGLDKVGHILQGGKGSKQGDVNSISIGSRTNIQDNSLVHVAKSNLAGKVLPTIIGDNVTIGHSAVLHGCTIEDEAFVGMGATLLDGVFVEKHAMVAAGALVRQDTRIPCGEVWAGNPAKFLRKLTEEEIAFISQSATNYSNLAQVHAAENAKSFDEIEFEKVLRKKFAHRDEEYDSMLGVVRETPRELVLPDNILPDKAPKAA